MKPIDNPTGVERAVSALLGKTAEVVTTTLADKIMGVAPAKRRRSRASAKTKRTRRAKSAAVKGGGRHG
jgi:hypothetical protein